MAAALATSKTHAVLSVRRCNYWKHVAQRGTYRLANNSHMAAGDPGGEGAGGGWVLFVCPQGGGVVELSS